MILGAFILLSSCNTSNSSNSKKSKNFEVKRYKNETLVEVYNAYTLNGDTIKDGEQREYYLSNGKLSYIRNYKDGNLNGLIKHYYDNGAVECSYEFINDKKKDGEIINFFPNGQIAAKRQVVGGKYENEAYTYYTSGKVKELLFYKNDKLDHVIYTKDNTGKELTIGSLKNGSGSRITYHPDGKIEAVSVYKDGKLIWKPLSLDSLGNIRSSGDLIDGKGYHIRYYDNGYADTINVN
jgi:antitoxin component YwqK of YwqJK toxin-antitoxin module